MLTNYTDVTFFEVYDQFFGLCGIQYETVVVSPLTEGTYQFCIPLPVCSLYIPQNECQCQIKNISECSKRLILIKICCVLSGEVRGYTSSLWDPSIGHHGTGYIFIWSNKSSYSCPVVAHPQNNVERINLS